LLLMGVPCAEAQDTSVPPQGMPIVTEMQLEPDVRGWFRNPDGSCVQCSLGMVGVHCNDIKATTLLWDSPYGPAERGGSWPARVANYCNVRGIKAYNITGPPTLKWIVWAGETGRYAAIGAGRSHFQTFYGLRPVLKADGTPDRHPDGSPKYVYLVCNNNSTDRIDEYSEERFRQLHYESGPWIVVLQKPSSENPVYTGWHLADRK